MRGGGRGRETQQPPGVCIPMGKAVCNKTHNRVKEEEGAVKSFFSVLSRWAVCCLAAVPSVTITTPRSYRPPAAQPGWYSGGRGIKLSARIVSLFPPHARNQISCGCFLLTFRVGFFSVLGVAGMEMERRLTPRGSAPSQPLVCCCCFLSACSSRGCFFFLPRRASCYIHESLCDRLPSLPALVSRRSHPGRFDRWRLNDPQEVVSAFTLPLAVPNVSMYQQV